MKAIIAVNNLGYIGLNNGLPWPPNKEDFKHFKSLTMNSKLIVGYNTFQTLPPLKGREVILVDHEIPLIHYTEADWCIGGKKTYEKFAPYFTELHISRIDNNSIGDTMFPDFSSLNTNCQIFNYNF